MVSEGANFSIPCLADVLELTERDVARALKYWEKESLLKISQNHGEIQSIELLPVPGHAKPVLETEDSSPVSSAEESSISGAEAIPAMKTLSPSELRRRVKMNVSPIFSMYVRCLSENRLPAQT